MSQNTTQLLSACEIRINTGYIIIQLLYRCSSYTGNRFFEEKHEINMAFPGRHLLFDIHHSNGRLQNERRSVRKIRKRKSDKDTEAENSWKFIINKIKIIETLSVILSLCSF